MTDGHRNQDDAPAGDAHDGIGTVAQMLLADSRAYFPDARTSPRIAGMHVVRRRLSDIARVALDFGDSVDTVYVKVHKKAGRSSEHLRQKMLRDFQTLSFLDGALDRDAGCRVPVPVAMFPEQLAVVTRAADGQPLHRLIRACAPVWKGSAQAAPLLDACRRTGRWLREFQSATALTAQVPFAANRLLERVRADLDICVGLGLPGSEARRIDAFCSDQFARYDGAALPSCGVHPDFQPDNVLVSPRTVTVLDFSDFHHGPPFSDVARFLASVDFFARNPLYRSARLRQLMTAFIDGYSGGPAEVGPLLGAWFVRFLARSTAGTKSWSRGFSPGASLARSLAVGFLSAWEERLEGMLRAIMGPARYVAAAPHPSATPNAAWAARPVATTRPDSNSGGQER